MILMIRIIILAIVIIVGAIMLLPQTIAMLPNVDSVMGTMVSDFIILRDSILTNIQVTLGSALDSVLDT